MSAQPQVRLSPEEYLALDRSAEFRSEYYDGFMVAMAGASFGHVRITRNLTVDLDLALMGKNCEVFPTELRLRVDPKRLYTYPDISVVCGEPKLADDHKDTLLNPVVLIEILSPSTEVHDRGFKFAHYQKLDSLQEYLLISQAEPRVETFRRQADGNWLYSDVRGLGETCRIHSIDCQILLSQIYRQVSFDPQP